ncbi:MAG: ABC transporter ATP-binding protein [Lachnospiraceae bacterium]
MLEVKKIVKIYDNDGVKTEALKGVDLKIENGEYIAVMGASGSGKSTLLHILGGMDRATAGEYYYNDIRVDQLKENQLHEFRKNHVSFIFQNFALMKYYTVFENVEMPLLSKGLSSRERKRIVEEKLELTGISDLAKKLPIHISGGQQQRCAIARALASGNELILADEPTGALDSGTGQEIMDIFDRINEMEKTIILITHDPKVAERANRIIRIEDGLIRAQK